MMARAKLQPLGLAGPLPPQSPWVLTARVVTSTFVYLTSAVLLYPSCHLRMKASAPVLDPSAPPVGLLCYFTPSFKICVVLLQIDL